MTHTSSITKTGGVGDAAFAVAARLPPNIAISEPGLTVPEGVSPAAFFTAVKNAMPSITAIAERGPFITVDAVGLLPERSPDHCPNLKPFKGILDPVELVPSIDRAALIGFPAAEDRFGIDGSASTVYVRTDPESVDAVRDVLPATANPQAPNEVEVTPVFQALKS